MTPASYHPDSTVSLFRTVSAYTADGYCGLSSTRKNAAAGQTDQLRLEVQFYHCFLTLFNITSTLYDFRIIIIWIDFVVETILIFK